jgi:hypothetical protein
MEFVDVSCSVFTPRLFFTKDQLETSMINLRITILTASIMASIACCTSADDPSDSVSEDKVVLHFVDGRVEEYPAAALRKVSFVTRASAASSKLPMTSEHVLIQTAPSTEVSIDQKADDWLTVPQDNIESPEWQQAILEAKYHQGGRGHYTLLRVLLDDPATNDRIQLRNGPESLS